LTLVGGPEHQTAASRRRPAGSVGAIACVAMPETVRREPGEIDPDDYLFERYHAPGRRRRVLDGYYAIKPLVPHRLRMAARRVHARYVHPSFPHWPIEPLLIDHQRAVWQRALSERPASRLPLVGFWPDGRRFAVIVTHDVESARGIANMRSLLEIEREHGVCSSWNFVAEWYPIPAETFELVRSSGGEIGLHGIRHDGLLFSDRRSFSEALPAIQRYMREWEAVGFRSPATHRNAEWMRELGCLYDSSFPDTDPYEPQPGGCCSIFPYFLGDVVELPVTMVQDHTLWEVLRQPNIDLWRQKGDWVMANQGLVNVIVHPDYVRSAKRLELYSELLGYLRQRVDERHGWHALPREVAGWWKARAQMRVVEDGAVAHIACDGPAGGWSDRATVAWACEQDGSVSIDV
jgi:peptidoglycan/xylan/chitin deacetylase (PgdA/CDA1 family)